MQAMPVEDERSMQRSMLAALLGGGDQPDATPAVDRASSPDEEDHQSDESAPTPPAAAAHAAPRPQQTQDGGAAADQPRTVFVRGLPAGTTEPLLRGVMSKFGPLKACRSCTPPWLCLEPSCNAVG
jgi:hypothetical protein